MTIAYLGLFSKILNWVLGKIFTPVFNFLANLLGSIFSWIFNEILGPLLQVVLKTVFPLLIDILVKALAYIFYGLLEILLTIVDTIMTGFNILIGLEDVTYKVGSATADGKLIEVLFRQNTLSTIFLCVTLFGLGIAFLLAIYATMRSSFDLDMEGKRPIGQVLTACFKTGISFLMVPLFCFLMIHMSGLILNAFDDAILQDKMSPGTTIFLVSAMDAAKDSDYNKNQEFSDPPRADFINGKLSYHKVGDVETYYEVDKIDYLVGFSSAIFMVIILGICMVLFVQRIFEVLILYICSPLFVSTIPLDDGERFSKWREMFVAKVFTGFGSAIGMKLYLMLMPLIMGSGISFVTAESGDYSDAMNYMIKLLFILGGAWAVYKSSSMLTMLLNFQAGQSESATASLVGGYLFSSTAGRMGGMMSRGMSRLRSGSEEGKKKQEEKRKEAKQEFRARSGGLPGSSGIPGLSKQSFGGGAKDSAGASPPKFGPRGRYAPKDDPSRRVATMGRLRLDKNESGKLQVGKWEGSRISIGRTESGSLALNRLKVAGLKWERDDNGKMNLSSVSMIPGLKFKRSEADGKMHLTHLGSKSGGIDIAHSVDESGKSSVGAVRVGNWVFGGGAEAPADSSGTEDAPAQTWKKAQKPPAKFSEQIGGNRSKPPAAEPPSGKTDGPQERK